ncbi:MAG: two-component response regulator [Neobacillus sp.]|jgi:DNA-binding response OmpR family regulator|nr:two-component response regulator [Neobacillus sp.]
MRVLIVEDDFRILRLIADYFKDSGFEVVEAGDGAKALLEFGIHNVDIVILDIMLPTLDGWEVCKNIRLYSNVPIIILTAKNSETDNLKGFELGADDYITKPFNPKVLVAKAKALLKRAETDADSNEKLLYIDKGFYIETPSHKAMLDNTLLNLTTTEYSLLLCLARNNGIVLTRDVILDKVWGINYFGVLRVVDININRLREKLRDRSSCIQTVRGVGYRFEIPKMEETPVDNLG